MLLPNRYYRLSASYLSLYLNVTSFVFIADSEILNYLLDNLGDGTRNAKSRLHESAEATGR